MKTIEATEYRRRELTVDQLQGEVNPANLPFEDTSELPGLMDRIVGQERAVAALEFGLLMTAEGYNVFVVGPVGTGKTTYTVQKVKTVAKNKPVPDDWCYVYNFQSPDQPLVLRFPAGQAHRFREAINQLVRELEDELTRQFESDEYTQQSGQLLKKYNDQAEQVWALLELNVRQLGMALQRTSSGMVAVPLTSSGKPMTTETFEALTDSDKATFQHVQHRVEEMADETMRQIRAIQKEARQAQRVLDERTAGSSVDHLFEDIVTQFPGDKVQSFLARMKADVIEHHGHFRRDTDPETASGKPVRSSFDPKRRYQVNIIVDRQGHEGAPVVIESNPTYFNLFGKVEYRGANGVMASDYTLVKPGALHEANGGYLIVQAQDLLTYSASWYGLKRALKDGEIRIDNPTEETPWMAPSGLKPEPVPLSVKIILIGTPYLFHLLYEHDPALRKYFKVKAEFDAETPRTPEACMEYANFIASFTREQNLPAFSRAAVMKILDHSARESEDHGKLATQFNPIIELIQESSFYAKAEHQKVVQADHVKRALLEKRQRSDLVKEKVLELIVNGTIRVDTQGERVGQINGLAVLNNGDFVFGQPHRITARTYIGRRGVVNVERETSMSGQIHDKGLLILSAYLAGEFAQKRPLSVSASVVFEQMYSMIDGDSASSTELYVLLSSLANVPIKQGIAVTGSVDQFGEIQPIGGVNEKIEGFFYVCQAQGLTGDQGVMIPHQNVANLFLSDEVVDAVRDGKFHIWPVKTIKEGIEILTGVVAGEAPYAEDTLFGVVERRMDEIAKSTEND